VRAFPRAACPACAGPLSFSLPAGGLGSTVETCGGACRYSGPVRPVARAHATERERRAEAERARRRARHRARTARGDGYVTAPCARCRASYRRPDVPSASEHCEKCRRQVRRETNRAAVRRYTERQRARGAA
jgi:hypothetical protein